MVVAITAGIVLAAILFMKEMAAATRLTAVAEPLREGEPLPVGWRVFSINGPLFLPPPIEYLLN